MSRERYDRRTSKLNFDTARSGPPHPVEQGALTDGYEGRVPVGRPAILEARAAVRKVVAYQGMVDDLAAARRGRA